MAEPTRTQKQIAERYKGSLDYYKRPHPWRRARFVVSFLAIVGGIAAVAFYNRHAPEEFFNTGPISSHHAHFAGDCKQCHEQTLAPRNLLDPHAFGFALATQLHGNGGLAAIDRKCQACHQQHNFHQPNVVENRTCSSCHREHQGPGPMPQVASLQCAACHNNADIMRASAEKGRSLAPNEFPARVELARLVTLNLPRPPDGRTQVIDSFHGTHPEFQLHRDRARDPNVLRFNHQRHFADDIPLLSGQKLDCTSCHQLQADGRYTQRVSFAANCQSCHSLQFDPRNPELHLPHGDPVLVRAFLRSLPSQYESLALKKGLTNAEQVRRFVSTEMTVLRDRVRTGADFEQQIFYTANPYRHDPQQGSIPRGAMFHGCAYCHQVTPAASGTPVVTKPVLIDRWMPHGQFNHAKHSSIACTDCHDARGSRDTVDVLMPVKATCVSCHNPEKRIASDCVTCHTFHNVPANTTTTAGGAAPGAFRQLLIGR
jgi:predicted CXXCH cytochrome family protein